MNNILFLGIGFIILTQIFKPRIKQFDNDHTNGEKDNGIADPVRKSGNVKQ